MNVLITGTTQGGIGFETAKELLKRGYRVLIVNRNREKTEDVVNALKSFGQVVKAGDELELEDLNSVKKFVQGFREPAINMLINNAGIMAVPELERTKQGFEKHVGVNFVSHYLLTRLLVPKLMEGAKKSGVPSRVINVSSDAHLWAKDVAIDAGFQGIEPYNARQQYALSKMYQLWDTADINEKFAAKSSSPAIISFVLHPGVISTNLSRSVAPAAMQALKESNPSWVFLTPTQGAATTLLCATAPLAELKTMPPLKTREQQIQYYRDSARAAPSSLNKLTFKEERVKEVVDFTDRTLRRMSFL